jgi:phosphate/sulfate permease
MISFLLLAVIVLAILAVADLVVGVGNDAVNFLNSAIGSKVASFRVIMWVATAGIFVGALSSAGMMEIAREGIFNPEYFSLEEVIIIFLAVMITDIFLLDAFNSLGLPTSTTVSIIFELLGAAIVVSIFKILTNNEPMNLLFNINDASESIIGYINWEKTNTIVSSIFLSVIISFTVGAFIMFLSRMLFSFQFQKRIKTVGLVWASLAMLAMSYFLIYKGLKSTYSTKELAKSELLSYSKAIDPMGKHPLVFGETIKITDVEGNVLEFNEKTNDKGKVVYEVFFGNKSIKSFIDNVKSNMALFLLGLFVFWIITFYILEKINLNPLKIVVFAGTFSLAMAFAGNDLVNFIGVPLAGWQSYDMFEMANSSTGGLLDFSTYKMVGLKFPIQTPYIFLIAAGLVMVLTLWFSSKAKTVTETEVKLGMQEETFEKFKSNAISRGMVRGSIGVVSFLKKILPESAINYVSKQFVPIIESDAKEAPAFDLVRASVNLTVASMLIALATSLKLPLSTTYVSFMVAMGTSLADKAWGRESASYRIAGVLHVIMGWFITAGVAFSVAALMAIILINFKIYGLIFLLLGLLTFISFTNYNHRKAALRKEKAEDTVKSLDFSVGSAFQKSSKEISEGLLTINKAFKLSMEGLLNEDKSKIKKAKNITNDLKDYYSDVKNNLFKAIKKSKLNEKQTAQLYILTNDLMQDILQSLTFIISATESHVSNVHKPLLENQIARTIKLTNEVDLYINQIAGSLNANDYTELKETKRLKKSIFDQIEIALSEQVEGITKKDYGFKNTDLTLKLLLEIKDLVAISVRFSKLLNRLNKGKSPLGTRDQI